MQSLPLKLDSGGQTTVYHYVYSNDVFIFNYFFIRSRDIEAIKYSFFTMNYLFIPKLSLPKLCCCSGYNFQYC